VAHSAAGGSGLSSNKANNGQVSGVVLGQPCSSLFFSLTSDFTNHNNTFGLGVNDESLKAVDEVGAVERITSNTNDGRLAESLVSGLVYCLVCEGA